MTFSNLVAFFILITAVRCTLRGLAKGIQTSADAAKALQSLAGNFAFLPWGSSGAGLLAIPFLAGSAAYAIAETFRWRDSLESKPRQAPKFYIVLAAATIIGMSLHFLGMDPIRALCWSDGVVAVPLMPMLMIVSANRRIIGKFLPPPHTR